MLEIPGVIIKRLEKNIDGKGWLIEGWRHDEIDYLPNMLYISAAEFGEIRGPHEHLLQSDFFVFVHGDFELYLWDNRAESEGYRKLNKVIVGAIKLTSILIPPGVVHGYKCISEDGGLCINLPNKLYRGLGKKEKVDEIRWEHDPNSPFKIE